MKGSVYEQGREEERTLAFLQEHKQKFSLPIYIVESKKCYTKEFDLCGVKSQKVGASLFSL